MNSFKNTLLLFIISLSASLYYCNQDRSDILNPQINPNDIGNMPVDSNSIYQDLNIGNVISARVEYFDSLTSNYPIKSVTIKNSDTLQKIVNLLKLLPDAGQIMVKFAYDVKWNNLILTESTGKFDTITIIDNRIRTPATSFYNPIINEEIQLVNLVVDGSLR